MESHDRALSPAQRYEAAHEAHYVAKDLREALGLYRAIIAEHPDAGEASYSRAQIENIVKSVVPEAELLDSHVSQAMAHVDPPSAAGSAQASSEGSD